MSAKTTIRTAGEADVPALIEYVAALRAERLPTIFRYASIPSSSRPGIGSRLLDTAIAWARQRSIRRLELEVLSNNPGARRLYERKGFVVEGSRHGAVEVDGAFVDAILMARDVGPAA